MKTAAIVALAMGLSAPAAAQTYVQIEDSAPYVPLTGGSVASFISNDDGTDNVDE